MVLWSRVYRYPGYTWVSVPNLRICRVPVSRSYRTDTGIQSYRTQQSVGYWYRVCVEVTNVSGTGTELVPNLPICRLPVSNLYRTYRSVGYSYRHCTEHTEVSGTGIGKKTNLPKCRVLVLRPYRTNSRTICIAVEGVPVPGVPVSNSCRGYRSFGVSVSSSYRTLLERSVG